MLKLLTCLVVIFGLCLATLLLRQQRQWIGFRLNETHSRIEQIQGELWTQQVAIAQATAPKRLAETVSNRNIPMSGIRSYPAARRPFDTAPTTQPQSADAR